MSGMQSVVIIDDRGTPSRAGVVDFHARLNGEMLRYYLIAPYHSTYQGGSVRSRDDVGIVPYKQIRSLCMRSLAIAFEL